MKNKLDSLIIGLALLAGVNQATAQLFPAQGDVAFFRISGPAATTIIAFNSDGTLVWSNAQPGVTYTIQTTTTLDPNWVGYIQLPVTLTINTNLLFAFHPPAGMALIPAGSFTIGNSIGDSDITDAVPTTVTVSAIYMDVNLVSSNQWAGVYTYAISNRYVFSQPGFGRATNNPVQTVDWYDCVKWCNARSAQASLTPVYYTDADFTQLFTNGDNGTTVFANWSANGYRLPTEAEWEKAARGGLSGLRFPWDNTISESQANYYADPGIYTYDLGPYTGYNTNFYSVSGSACTSPVGYFAPNGYRLNDMAGNVFEWCWDWYAPPPYPAGSPYLGGTNPTGPATGSLRVLRGGGWNGNASGARCAERIDAPPNYYDPDIGFRCVRGL